MATTPQIGLSKLHALRARERLCHVAWGASKWLAVAAGALIVSTFIDWRIDKFRETPQYVRLLLTALQASGLGIAAWFWLIKPWAKGPNVIRLARRVEEGIPEFGHRLVTAIQLTKQPPPGMSPELIDTVARESEQIAGKHSFSQFADTRRMKWAGGLILAPIALIGLAMLVYGSSLFAILVQRQFLRNVEIPRFNSLENLTPELWPAGDEVLIEYAVRGRIGENELGRVRVKPEGLPADEYPLEYARRIDDSTTVFAAKVPHSSIAFEHRAWAGDGRTRNSSPVRFEPRPVVTRTDAWTQLPTFLGKRPDGGAYETYQAQGEIIGLASSNARVRIGVQKPTTEAKLVLIARTADGTGEADKSTRPMRILPAEELPTGEANYPAEVTFELSGDLVAYRVEVKDENGFANSTPPRRGIQIAPDEAPVVRLLPERYADAGSTASDEDIIDGLPIPLGGQVPIAYICRSPQGVGKATLRYRVNEKGNWIPLNLKDVNAEPKYGPFDPNRGTFSQAPYGLQVEFYPQPSSDRDTTPDFLAGGGRFDFQTAELTKVTDDGQTAKLEVGDRVEFYVEVYDRNPAPGRKPGRSETRMKEVLSAAEVLQRLDQTRQSEAKIRDLEKKQRDIFGRKRE